MNKNHERPGSRITRITRAPRHRLLLTRTQRCSTRDANVFSAFITLNHQRFTTGGNPTCADTIKIFDYRDAAPPPGSPILPTNPPTLPSVPVLTRLVLGHPLVTLCIIRRYRRTSLVRSVENGSPTSRRRRRRRFLRTDGPPRRPDADGRTTAAYNVRGGGKTGTFFPFF